MLSDAPQLNAQKPHSLIRDIFIFYALLAAAVYFVYEKPTLAPPFFLYLLVLAWFSKKDYFWLAFFFLIIQQPARLFIYSETSYLPLVRIFQGVSIDPMDCFTILMLIKIIIYKGYAIKVKLKTPFILLILYFIFSFFCGILFYSTSLNHALFFLRNVIYFCWIIFFIAFLKSKEDVFNFSLLIFPVVLIIISDQIYVLAQGTHLINILDPGYTKFIEKNSLTNEVRTATEGVLALFLSYIGSLVLLQYGEKKINNKYLYFVMTLSFLSIFLSATRSWFGIFLFIFAGTFLKSIQKAPKILIGVILILIFLGILVHSGIFSGEYIKDSLWGRVSQVFDLLGGQGKKIDTFESRLIQLKAMFEKIGESPFFGFGFSDVSREYYNSNWGFPNTILMFGIFGLILFIFLFVCYLKMMFAAQRKLPQDNPLRNSIRILIISFFAMLGGYCFTWDFFSLLYSSTVVFMMAFFGISEIFAREAREEICSNNQIK